MGQNVNRVKPDPGKNARSGIFFMPKLVLSILFVFLFFNPLEAAQRYISLAPSTTEILFALGLEDEIVGVSSQCNYPEQAKNKPRIGDFSSPNIESIVSLRPDYIFCTGLEQDPVITQIRGLKLNIYVADPVNTRELFQTVRDIGRITHKEQAAEQLIQDMQDRIDRITAKARSIPANERQKVFLEIWHEPLMSAAKGSFVDELISLSGGINIAHDLIRPYCNFSSEKVISLNPQCIILAYMDKEPPLKLVKQRFGWGKIDAVKSGRVFNDINPDLLLRPGPRIVQGLEEIYKRLYPNDEIR